MAMIESRMEYRATNDHYFLKAGDSVNDSARAIAVPVSEATSDDHFDWIIERDNADNFAIKSKSNGLYLSCSDDDQIRMTSERTTWEFAGFDHGHQYEALRIHGHDWDNLDIKSEKNTQEENCAVAHTFNGSSSQLWRFT